MTEPSSGLVCYQLASMCLSYPDAELIERLPLMRAAADEHGWAEHFRPVFDHLGSGSLMDAQTYHVAEFDISRKHALHLSYWTDGDTRRRGAILAAFKQVYRDSGLLVDTHGELPDYLPLVLEFAAVGDHERGADLLRRYRPSLDLLRLQLIEDDLPHVGMLVAVCATLPGPTPGSRAEVQAMVGEIAPHETVGLEPYGGLTPQSEPDLLQIGRR